MGDRELDAWIATHVMGKCPHSQLSLVEDSSRRCSDCGVEMFNHRIVLRYSSEIAAAWTVVEKMWCVGWLSKVSAGETYYHCDFWRFDLEWLRSHDGTISVSAATAPLAICLAARKAVEEKKGNKS